MESEKLIKNISNARSVTIVDIVISKGTVDKVFLALLNNGNTPRFIPKFNYTTEELEKLPYDSELTYTLEFPETVNVQVALAKLQKILIVE